MKKEYADAAGLDELVELVRRMETDESGKKLWAYGTILAYCYDRIAALRQAQAEEK